MPSNKNRKLTSTENPHGSSADLLRSEIRGISDKLDDIAGRISAIDDCVRALDQGSVRTADKVSSVAIKTEELAQRSIADSDSIREGTFEGRLSFIMTFLVGGLTIGFYIGNSITPELLGLFMIGGTLVMVGFLILPGLNRKKG